MAGEAGDEVPAGLLLNAVDPVVERIVLGQASPGEHGAVKSNDVTPADIAKKARRGRKGAAADEQETDADRPASPDADRSPDASE